MGEPATGSLPTLSHLHVEPGRNASAVLRNLSIHVWLTRANDAEGQRLLELSRTLADEHPMGVSALQWIAEGAGLPETPVRNHVMQILREQGSKLGEIATVLDGGGFWASAYRGVLTGLRMAAGERAGFRVFANLDEAAAWLPGTHQGRTGIAISATEVRTATLHLISLARS